MHPLLTQLVAELRAAFPNVIGNRTYAIISSASLVLLRGKRAPVGLHCRLTHLWAYKYSQDERGIRVHAGVWGLAALSLHGLVCLRSP